MSQASSVFRFATRSDAGIEWSLRKNCSVTPVQLGALYASLCVVSLGVAGFFWTQGATLVLPFAALELAAVALAFLFWARHATDSERICLTEGCLVVELESGGKLERCEFPRSWVRVDPLPGSGQLIEVRGAGRSVRVGRYLRADLRPALAREIRLALRGA